ncbi:MAG: G8 domain-containing protein [Pseudomonadota bacterium]
MSAVHAGHTSQLDLLPTDARGSAPLATHVAVNHGGWFDAPTWAGGKVPGAGALVHIPSGVSVSYEGERDAALFIVRVDGTLSFHADNGAATRMSVDTLITAPGSSLQIEAATTHSGTVDIVFTETTPAAHSEYFTTGTQRESEPGRSGWDPQQLSLGLIAAGQVRIHGQQVSSSLQLAEAPVTGSTELVFRADPDVTGWGASQKIAIGGTQFLDQNPDGCQISTDEIRGISGVRVEDGLMVVTLDCALDFDHPGTTNQRTDAPLMGHVANLTRNVTFSSAAAHQEADDLREDGQSFDPTRAPEAHRNTRRGHVMFLQSGDVCVQHVAFHGLGRTGSSCPTDDAQTQTNGASGTSSEQITNQHGRHPLCIHEVLGSGQSDPAEHGSDSAITGPCSQVSAPVDHDADQNDDGGSHCTTPQRRDGAWLEGTAIWGSPGWGIVQHASDAVLKGNAVYGVSGSAIVAETGTETGRWENNLTMNTHRLAHEVGAAGRYENTPDSNDVQGSEGNGFYLKARAIEVVGNIAQSSARSGFLYRTDGADLRKSHIPTLDIDGLGHGLESIRAEDVPIRRFEGNQVIAAETAIRITADPLTAGSKSNDAWSNLRDLTAWEIGEAGVSIAHASKFIFAGFLILGTQDKKSLLGQQDSSGFLFKNSVADITVLNSHVENFGCAVYNWTQVSNRQQAVRRPRDFAGLSESDQASAHDGEGGVDGVENPAYNLWNTTVVGVTGANLATSFLRTPGHEVETTGGTVEAMPGTVNLKASSDSFTPGVDIELLGDSRDGALVALWREDPVNNPDQVEVFVEGTPISSRATDLTTEVWSGAVLEFAKEDSLGRQIFIYEDFSPLQPELTTRAVSAAGKLIFSKQMIDGVLSQDGFYRVGGIADMRFVVMKMAFTDRLSGEIEVKSFLVALDLAWRLPDTTRDLGPLQIQDDLIVAPQYRAFRNGAQVAGRAPVTLRDEMPSALLDSSGYVSGAFATEAIDNLMLKAAADVVETAAGTDTSRSPGARDEYNAHWNGVQSFDGDGRKSRKDDAEHPHLACQDQRDLPVGRDGGGAQSNRSWRNERTTDNGDNLFFGGGDRDRLNGGDNQDALAGHAGEETLSGDSGADIFTAVSGNDRHTGGNGADRYVFEKNPDLDVITDFDDGVDAIEFLIDAFGYDDLDILGTHDDAVATPDGGSVHLLDVNAADLDANNFMFASGDGKAEPPTLN